MIDARKLSGFPVANSSQISASNTWFLSTDTQPGNNNYRVTPQLIVEVGTIPPPITAINANLSITQVMDKGVCVSNNANATLTFANTLTTGFRQQVVVADANSTLFIANGAGLTLLTTSTAIANQPGQVINVLKLDSTLIVY